MPRPSRRVSAGGSGGVLSLNGVVSLNNDFSNLNAPRLPSPARRRKR